MRSFIKLIAISFAIASFTACDSGDQASGGADSTKAVVIDTLESSAVSDSVAPVYAEPDSVPMPQDTDKVEEVKN